MSTKKNAPPFYFFPILLFLGLSFFAQTQVLAQENLNLKLKLQKLTDRIRQETKVPGISVYVKSPHFADLGVVSGVSNLKNEKPVTPVTEDTIFRIGSITKTYTGAAIMLLCAEGKLDLDSPINRYLNLPSPLTDAIKVRHCLNHSSGLQGYLNQTPFLEDIVLPQPTLSHTPAELLEWTFAEQQELLFSPGTEFAYNNTNYIILGMLIEKLSGVSYDAYIRDNFLVPLELNETFVLLDTAMPDNFANGYFNSTDDHSYENWTDMNMSYVWSAGCIAATAQDLASWLQELATGTIIPKNVKDIQFEGFDIVPGATYASGILIDARKGIGHNGTVVGFHSDAWYSPEHETVIAVLSNANIMDDDELENRDQTREIVEEFWKILDNNLYRDDYSYYLPYFTANPGEWSGLGLSNNSPAANADVCILIYDENGNKIATEYRTITTNGQDSFVVGAGLDQTGWVKIQSSQPLSGLSFAGISNPGSYIAEVPFSRILSKSLIIPHIAQDNSWNTEIFMANPNNNPISVNLTYLNMKGSEPYGSFTYSIPANGSNNVQILALTNDNTTKSGKVMITATADISAFALYNNLQSGGNAYAGVNANIPEESKP
ncbi:MAG: serine hydrolase domain-containing protein [Pseudomonadota bacterium]|nr:serine hydrolase domain-containing protein [Pseudomonadota bacterium]